eukprot:TRINITY_DN19740_c0_g1_i1.p2 TRINITY_DN19740_c0_g1~~TRINITY_DN19740_c0_g1_i1.p2  ORF type:complete len:165 (-),score=4.57 TRINITY_DN19740_c0_g1_i1:41-535(-)
MTVRSGESLLKQTQQQSSSLGDVRCFKKHISTVGCSFVSRACILRLPSIKTTNTITSNMRQNTTLAMLPTVACRESQNAGRHPRRKIVQKIQARKAVETAPCGSPNFRTKLIVTPVEIPIFVKKNTTINLESVAADTSAATQPSKHALAIASIVIAKLVTCIVG